VKEERERRDRAGVRRGRRAKRNYYTTEVNHDDFVGPIITRHSDAPSSTCGADKKEKARTENGEKNDLYCSRGTQTRELI